MVRAVSSFSSGACLDILRLGSLIIALVALVSVGQAAEAPIRSPSTKSDQYVFDRQNISKVRVTALTRSDPEEGKRQLASVSLGPFRTFQLAMARGPLFEKWNAVLKDFETEDQLLARCESNRTNCPPLQPRSS
jgi:hypothetical protein